MTQTPISLISFASDRYQDAVHTALEGVGYRVHNIDIAELNTASANLVKGVAVFLFADLLPGRDKLRRLLSDPDIYPRFGIFVLEKAKLDPKLICYMNEFSNWPCDLEELKLRLSRLDDHGRDNNPSGLSQELQSDLLNLNFIGRSSALINTVHRLHKFANCDSPVLIEGETGTGKELAARALHYLSNRNSHPFVPINCGAIPEHLIENELFGHEKGAYTDAGRATSGLIAQACNGSLFLDEIEALSPKAQVSLLRFIQEAEYRPLGSGRLLKANVRVIAASNKSLVQLVREAAFREDLYYRLDIMNILLPPLRERGRDIELLAEYFVSLYRKQYHQPEKYIHPLSLKRLGSYHWPGNVRELENMIHRAFLLSDGPVIYIDNPALITHNHAGRDGDHSFPYQHVKFGHAKAQVIREFEEQYLVNILKESDGNITLAAKMAGKERRALGKLLKKYSIDKYSI